MMVFTPINMEVFDKQQVLIGYCKLFPHLMKDFLTRVDCEVMMKASNLPVSTNVSTIVTGAAASTPPSTVTGKGTGSGVGQTTPAYVGSTPSPATEVLAREKQVIKDGGGTAVNKSLGALGNM